MPGSRDALHDALGDANWRSVRERDAREVVSGVETMPGSQAPRDTCNSLDQLYAQALVVNSAAAEKVKQWARSSKGFLPWAPSASHGHVSSTSAAGNFMGDDERPDLEARISRTALKKPRRTIEKLLRSYSNRPSQLADLCRHTITFDSLPDLTMCLGQIVTDNEIQVVRVKNRLSNSYDASLTAGYRDVAINYRVMIQSMCLLGAETHVCELQLILRQFAELKSDSGHRKYICYRNLRGQ